MRPTVTPLPLPGDHVAVQILKPLRLAHAPQGTPGMHFPSVMTRTGYLLNDYGTTRYLLIPTLQSDTLVYADTPELQDLLAKVRTQHPTQGLNLAHFGPDEANALSSAYLVYTLAGFHYLHVWADQCAGQAYALGNNDTPPVGWHASEERRTITLPRMTPKPAVMPTTPRHTP